MKFLKNLIINIGIFLSIIVVLFFIAEAVSRAVFSHQNEGATAINLQIFDGNDLYGWGHYPGAKDYHGYGNPTPEVNINSHGFRDDEVSIEKPEGTKRILVLGDSFTFGMNIAQPDIFTEVLERNLNESGDIKYEVINTGSIGYTTDNQYLLLKNKGMQFKPDIVVIAFFTGNDVTELRRHEWDTDENGALLSLTDTKHYVDNEHRLRYKGEEEPASYFLNFVNTRWIILQKKLGIYDDPTGQPTLTWPAFLEPDHPNGDPRIPQFWIQIESMLKAAKELTDENDAKLVVIAIPMDVQTNKKYWKKYSQMYFDDDAYAKDRPQTKLHELCETYGIDLIDLLPYFREADNEQWLYFEKIDPHWTKEGHSFAAEVIGNNLAL